MVFAGQLMVALSFAELAANFPVPGSIYNWGKKLASETVAWLGGWMMLTASIVTISAVALAYQLTLPQIWSFFQFYGDGTGKYDFAANAVILGTVLIIFTTTINALGVRLMARINSTGVFIELHRGRAADPAARGQHHPRPPTCCSRRRAPEMVGGLAYYLLVQRHKTGVLASHAFESPSDAVPDAEPAT